MKITICGSLAFSAQMLEAQDALEALGHTVQLPRDAEEVASGTYNKNDPEADFARCVERDIMREHFRWVAAGDAILVMNLEKNGVAGYAGASTLMEMGVAHHLGKKIFAMQPFPALSEERWAHEARMTQPIILHGDFSKMR